MEKVRISKWLLCLLVPSMAHAGFGSMAGVRQPMDVGFVGGVEAPALVRPGDRVDFYLRVRKDRGQATQVRVEVRGESGCLRGQRAVTTVNLRHNNAPVRLRATLSVPPSCQPSTVRMRARLSYPFQDEIDTDRRNDEKLFGLRIVERSSGIAQGQGRHQPLMGRALSHSAGRSAMARSGGLRISPGRRQALMRATNASSASVSRVMGEIQSLKQAVSEFERAMRRVEAKARECATRQYSLAEMEAAGCSNVPEHPRAGVRLATCEELLIKNCMSSSLQTLRNASSRMSDKAARLESRIEVPLMSCHSELRNGLVSNGMERVLSAITQCKQVLGNR